MKRDYRDYKDRNYQKNEKTSRLSRVRVDCPRLIRVVRTLEANALRFSRLSEPGSQRVREALVGLVSHPGHVSVRPNQHSGGSGDSP